MSKIFDSIQVPNEVTRMLNHSFDVADQIHEILESQGKTQRDLADLLGKKESEVSKWMRGTHNFTLKSISKIEEALGESILITPLKARKITKPSMVVVTATINKKISFAAHESATWKTQMEKSFVGGLKSA